MDLIKKLQLADYVSFISLFFAWVSIVLLMENSPNIAIMVNMVAFLFDALDGHTARKLHRSSSFGRVIDSYVDVFTYLVFASVLFYYYVSPSVYMSIIVGFLMVLFGGLRLIRYNDEGILQHKERPYYRGVTVLHMSFLTSILYFMVSLVHPVLAWPASFVLLFLSPLMLSNYKTYKTSNPLFFIVVIVIFFTLSLILEYGYSQ